MPHAPLALSLPMAALLLLLAIPAAVAARRGWNATLTREGRLGLHTPAAVASDEAFRLANKVSAPLVAGAAGVAGVCAVLVVSLPLGVPGAIAVGALGLVGALAQLYAASSMGERAAMTVPRPARKSATAGCCGGGGCGCGAGGCSSDGGSGPSGAGVPGAVSAASASGTGASGAASSPRAQTIPDLLPDVTVR